MCQRPCDDDSHEALGEVRPALEVGATLPPRARRALNRCNLPAVILGSLRSPKLLQGEHEVVVIGGVYDVTLST